VRDVQHRIATSRIQQEILEATQREKELVATGTIQTLSEDTVDSKVKNLYFFFQKQFKYNLRGRFLIKLKIMRDIHNI